MSRINVITDTPVSFQKIGEHVRYVALLYRDLKYDENTVVYVGSLLAYNPNIHLAKRIVAYVDIPRIDSRFKANWNMIKNKTILITNSKYCADLMERYYNIKVQDIVPHGVDTRFYNASLLNVPKRFHVMNMSQVYREGGDIYSTIVVLLKRVLPNIVTLHVARGRCIGADYMFELRQVLPDWLFSMLYAMSHCYLVTSRHEGFCMHVIEAGACGCIPVVPNTPPYVEHDVPFKVTFNATIDINRLWNCPDGNYPVVEFDINDVVKAIVNALKTTPSVTDIIYVCDRYNIARVYRRLLEYVSKR